MDWIQFSNIKAINLSKLLQGDNKMDSNLIWMQNFHRPEYIPMLIDQYQKVLTDNAEKLEEKIFCSAS